MISLGTIITASTILMQSAKAVIGSGSPGVSTDIAGVGDFVRKAPIDVSGDSIYVAWWNNKTGNDEVMFRASTDAGKTFGEKINLSNTPNSDSVNVQLAEDEGKVAVSWWERNQTSNEPVMRVSTDNGKTFGEKIMLSAKGPIA